jgi:hypothetical protein
VDGNSAAAVVVPVVSVVLGIGMVIVAIVTKHRRQMQELELRHRERMAAIEKGLELPPEPPSVTESALVAKYAARRGAGGNYLLRGLVWLGVGLAIGLSDGDGLFGGKSVVYGSVAAAVGAAYLIYYFVEGRREAPPPGDGGPRT